MLIAEFYLLNFSGITRECLKRHKNFTSAAAISHSGCLAEFFLFQLCSEGMALGMTPNILTAIFDPYSQSIGTKSAEVFFGLGCQNGQ